MRKIDCFKDLELGEVFPAEISETGWKDGEHATARQTDRRRVHCNLWDGLALILCGHGWFK